MRKLVELPYLHETVHDLKKSGEGTSVSVELSMLIKLKSLCRTTTEPAQKGMCGTQQVRQFVDCAEKFGLPLAFLVCEYLHEPDGKKKLFLTEGCYVCPRDFRLQIPFHFC